MHTQAVKDMVLERLLQELRARSDYPFVIRQILRDAEQEDLDEQMRLRENEEQPEQEDLQNSQDSSPEVTVLRDPRNRPKIDLKEHTLTQLNELAYRMNLTKQEVYQQIKSFSRGSLNRHPQLAYIIAKHHSSLYFVSGPQVPFTHHKRRDCQRLAEIYSAYDPQRDGFESHEINSSPVQRCGLFFNGNGYNFQRYVPQINDVRSEDENEYQQDSFVVEDHQSEEVEPISRKRTKKERKIAKRQRRFRNMNQSDEEQQRQESQESQDALQDKQQESQEVSPVRRKRRADSDEDNVEKSQSQPEVPKRVTRATLKRKCF